MRPDGDRVIATEQREIVRDLEHVLVERVLLREPLETERDARA